MSEHKCPICGKSGLPNYRKEAAVCPACNTDLSVYLLINESDSKNSFFWKSLFGVSVLSIFVLAYFLVTKTPVKVAYNVEIQKLNDSIKVLQKEKSTLNNQLSKQYYYYQVRKFDSFCKVSKKFYGTEKFSVEIAQFNGMHINDKLHLGDKLRMPQK